MVTNSVKHGNKTVTESQNTKCYHNLTKLTEVKTPHITTGMIHKLLSESFQGVKGFFLS